MSSVLRVIIVDDSAADAELIAHKLQKNYTVEHAILDNAADLRKALVDKIWDIVLCDYSMPDFDPYRVLNILKEYDFDIPLIVITGTIGEEKAIQLLKAGCSDCILKTNMTRLPGLIDREIKEALIRKENRILNARLQKYQLLSDEASDAMLFIDMKGNILDVNHAAMKQYGYTDIEFLKLNIADLWRENDRGFIENQMKTAADKGIRFDAVHYRKDGSPFYVDVSSQGAILEGNKILLSIIRDITERKQDQGLILASEIRYRRLFESAKDGILILDAETGKIVDVNPFLITMLGYSKEELLEKMVWEIGAFKDTIGNQDNFQKLQTNGYIRYENLPLETKSGQQIEVEFVSNVYSADNKKVIQCNIRDITERRKAEAAIHYERSMANMYLNMAGVIFVALDRKGIVTLINTKGCEILGLGKEDILGKNWMDHFVPKSIASEVKRVFYTMLEGEIKPVEYYENLIVTANGEERLVSWHNTVLRDESGEIIGSLAAGNDITEVKNVEEKIAHLASFPQLNPDPIIELNADGSISYANAAAKTTFPDLESLGILHPFLMNSKAIAAQILKEGINPIEREIMVGDHVYAQTLQYLESSKTMRIYSRDITVQKKTEEALKESERKYSSYIENAPDGVFITDESGHFLEANPAASDITGYRTDEILTMTILDILTEKFQKSGKNHFRMIFEKGSAEAELQHRRKNGSVRWLNVNAVKLTDTRVLGFVKDVTVRKRTENKLVYLSYHDQLTGLYNRRFFEEEFRRLDTKRNLPLSVIMGDINGLKFINDSFGHSTGDAYLKKAAEIIKKSCRADDIIARLGGDEFVILLPKADATDATKIINRILLKASTQTVSNFALSISFGYDTKTTDDQSILEIMANAESYMYRHKVYERTSIRSKTIDIIMDALFLKSNRESQHSERVSMISELIASNMDFEKDDVNQIKIAGLIHDIGKIGIDEKILNKVGRLSNEEWEEIRKHPEAGWRILSSSKEFSELARFILHHHEKFDGSGYPNGLKGEEIPIEARIITIADAYDAITSERSYRKGASKEEAIEEIQRCSGTHFDPKIVDVLINKVLPDLM